MNLFLTSKNIKKEAISTFKLILIRLLFTVFGFGFTVYLSKVLGIKFYGSYFEILKFIQLFTLLGLLGYPSLISRNVNINIRDKTLHGAFKTSIIISLTLYIIYLIKSINVDDIILLVLGLFILIFNVFTKIYEAIRISEAKPIKATLFNISLIHSLFFIVLVMTSNLNLQVDETIFYIFFLTLISLFLFFFKFDFGLDLKFSEVISLNKLYYIKSSLKIFAYKANRIALTKFDIIMLSFFANPIEIGVYGIASRFPSIADSLYNIISSNITGRLSKANDKKNIKDFKLIFFSSCVISLLISILVIFFFIIFFNPLMRIFELDIVLGVKSLILFILPSSINLIFGQIETFMNVLKYENVLYKSSMISFPLIICTMVVGTYFRSIDSVLISLIIGSIILNIVNIFFFIKTYKTAFN